MCYTRICPKFLFDFKVRGKDAIRSRETFCWSHLQQLFHSAIDLLQPDLLFILLSWLWRLTLTICLDFYQSLAWAQNINYTISLSRARLIQIVLFMFAIFVSLIILQWLGFSLPKHVVNIRIQSLKIRRDLPIIIAKNRNPAEVSFEKLAVLKSVEIWVELHRTLPQF